MAAVTGPISSLPGSSHSVPKGMKCDECTNEATHRIQGETDSMGCEMIDLCDECFSALKEAEKDIEGNCDWCKSRAVLRPRRDYDEGMSGPVYYVCKPCVEKDNARINAELEDEDAFDYDEEYHEDPHGDVTWILE